MKTSQSEPARWSEREKAWEIDPDELIRECFFCGAPIYRAWIELSRPIRGELDVQDAFWSDGRFYARSHGGTCTRR